MISGWYLVAGIVLCILILLIIEKREESTGVVLLIIIAIILSGMLIHIINIDFTFTEILVEEEKNYLVINGDIQKTTEEQKEILCFGSEDDLLEEIKKMKLSSTYPEISFLMSEGFRTITYKHKKEIFGKITFDQYSTHEIKIFCN